MAALHPHMFLPSIVDESEIHKLVANHLLPDHAMLQWRPATREDMSYPVLRKRERSLHTYAQDVQITRIVTT
jgi:hypothetical protein